MYAPGVASRRTQLYLDDRLRERIDRVRARDGRTMAEVVRDALERYLEEDERVRRPLAESASRWVGAWRDRESEVPQLRREVEDRLRRLDS
jgi:predicted DNA-binding protein